MIVLDTHVLIWWLSGSKRLSAKARRLIDQEGSLPKNILVSSISSWEISMLVSKDRLKLSVNTEEWVRQAERIESILFVPLDNQIAIRATQLPEPLHKDRADRMIIATAKQMGCPLVTADEKILAYPHVETIW